MCRFCTKGVVVERVQSSYTKGRFVDEAPGRHLRRRLGEGTIDKKQSWRLHLGGGFSEKASVDAPTRMYLGDICPGALWKKHLRGGIQEDA